MGVAREPLQTYRLHLCSFSREVRAGAMLTVMAGVLRVTLVSKVHGIFKALLLTVVGASGAAILREEAAGAGLGIPQTRREHLPRFPAAMGVAQAVEVAAWVAAVVVAREDIW